MLDPTTSSLFWQQDALPELYERLVLESGLPVASARLATRPRPGMAGAMAWINWAPRRAGLDIIEERVSTGELLSRYLETAGPTITGVLVEGRLSFVAAILEGRTARVLKPDGTEARLGVVRVHAAVEAFATGPGNQLGAIFESLPGGRAAFERVLRSGTIGEANPFFFRLELGASHSIASQLTIARAWRALATNVILRVVQSMTALGAVWTLGNAAIDGRLDGGRVLAWTILSLSDAPLLYLSTQAFFRFSSALSMAIRRRLLEGAFFVVEKNVRKQGFGRLLAVTNESMIVEQLSLGELTNAVSSLGFVVGAIVMFAGGALPALTLLALLAFVAAAALLVRSAIHAYAEVYQRGIGLTDDLADKIVGHRTRSIQQAPALRHEKEDLDLADYAGRADRLDSLRAASSLMPRLWLLVSGSCLLVAFLLRADTRAMLWTALGVLLAFRAFDGFFPSVERMVQWVTAMRGVGELFLAGRTRERTSREVDVETDGSLPVALSLSAVTFAHRSGGRPILNDANLTVRVGEKVLVEGSSGSGKTTLLKLIAGEARANAGVILLGGIEQLSVSERDWRRRVASAPQFHENYVFPKPLAFNLNGRADMSEADDICRELGLGPLIDRMPQGFSQILGETGWQLSHGEKSRIYIARALLQNSDVLLFDENFGSLDPETLLQALECVRRRAKTLIVVAHT